MRTTSAVRVGAIVAALAVTMTIAACSVPGAPGADIFASGQGHAGAIPRASLGRALTAEGPGCAGCHGVRGQGSQIGPPVTRAVLGSRHAITHKVSAEDPSPVQVSEGPWTPEQTADTVRTGKTPEGHYLGGLMPRWRLDSRDASALASYLGKL